MIAKKKPQESQNDNMKKKSHHEIFSKNLTPHAMIAEFVNLIIMNNMHDIQSRNQYYGKKTSKS